MVNYRIIAFLLAVERNFSLKFRGEKCILKFEIGYDVCTCLWISRFLSIVSSIGGGFE